MTQKECTPENITKRICGDNSSTCFSTREWIGQGLLPLDETFVIIADKELCISIYCKDCMFEKVKYYIIGRLEGFFQKDYDIEEIDFQTIRLVKKS